MANSNTFATLKAEERENRKRLIVDAAERIFCSKPPAKAGMREIAREAGISPASIYRYFPDRQALFVEAFLRGARELLESIRALIDENEDAGLDAVAAVFIDFLTENDHYFRMMTQFMLDGGIGGEALERLNAMVRTLLDELDRVFRRLGCPDNPRLRSHAFFAALSGVLISFRGYPGRTREEVHRHMEKVAGVISAAFAAGVERDAAGPYRRD